MLVKELMKKPNIVENDISLQEAAKLMSEHGIGSLLYVEKGKIKGIITEGDLLKNFGKEKKISEVMSKNIICAWYDETIENTVKTMRKNKVKRLPVIDEKKNLVGIISMTDIAANIEKLDEDFFFN